MPAEESTPAIVLRARDYSESDRIVTLLTRDLGKLSGIAKGAKASRRRFERKLDPFSHVILCFKRRPHGQLVFITRAEAADLEPFRLQDDILKIALGSYMLELADAFTSEEDHAAGAYRILAESLWTLSGAGAAPALRQGFELSLLRWAGFGLDFTRCRMCASPTPAADEAAFFAVPRGGMICARCRPDLVEGAVRLEARAARALARLSTLEIAQCSDAPDAGAAGAQTLARFIGSVLERRLRSTELLDSLMSSGAQS